MSEAKEVSGRAAREASTGNALNSASSSSANTAGNASINSSSGSSNGMPTSASTSTEKLGLEDIVHLANRIGLEYANAKRDAERYELLKPTIRARIALRLDDGSLTETKLKRLTETDSEYVDFLEKLVQAKGEAERLRIRYESYKNLFEARRSLLSYQKAEMKLL